MSLIERIEALYRWRGRQWSGSSSGVPLTYLQHALRTAQLAESDDAAEVLVAAAFLHDIGLILPARLSGDGSDVAREDAAVDFLRAGFDGRVLEPIRLQGQARRYLAALHADPEPRAPGSPSPPSAPPCGGPMPPREMQRFQAHPHAAEAVQVRRWARCARLHTHKTPPLTWYLGLLEAAMERMTPLAEAATYATGAIPLSRATGVPVTAGIASDAPFAPVTGGGRTIALALS